MLLKIIIIIKNKNNNKRKKAQSFGFLPEKLGKKQRKKKMRISEKKNHDNDDGVESKQQPINFRVFSAPKLRDS